MDKLIPHKYGKFKKSQIDYYKQKLRKKIFWLVLYTDKNTKDDFNDIDVVKYHQNLLFEISSCNNSLECALSILESDEFDFCKYKKLVFDAGAMLQRMKVGDK